MDLISILATVILATTAATVLMGFVAYAAFKLREKRKPVARITTTNAESPSEPIFFTRFTPATAMAYAGEDDRVV